MERMHLDGRKNHLTIEQNVFKNYSLRKFAEDFKEHLSEEHGVEAEVIKNSDKSFNISASTIGNGKNNLPLFHVGYYLLGKSKPYEILFLNPIELTDAEKNAQRIHLQTYKRNLKERLGAVVESRIG